MRNGSEQEKREHDHESELVEKIRRQNHGAFRELVETYQKKLFRFAYGFLQDREDAMEIVQETFIRFYEKIDQWRSGTSPSPWIFRIAHNLCIDHYRKHHRQKKVTDPLDDVWEKDVSALWPSQDRGEQERLLALVGQSLQDLSPRQKSVFVMKHQEGKKLEEIAAIFGTSLGTIKTLHHRALGKIRRRLKLAGQEVKK